MQVNKAKERRMEGQTSGQIQQESCYIPANRGAAMHLLSTGTKVGACLLIAVLFLKSRPTLRNDPAYSDAV